MIGRLIQSLLRREILMKRILSLTLVLLLILTMAACTGADKTSSEEPATDAPVTIAPTTMAPTTPAPTVPPSEAHVPPEPVETEAPDNRADFYGVWYGSYEGMTIRLELLEDMTYVRHYALNTEDSTGSWEMNGDHAFLDGNETFYLAFTEEGLYWYGFELAMSREERADYVPAELSEDVPLEAYAGYWKSIFVDMDGVPVPSALLEEDTDLYIDGTMTALGGSIFGDVFLEMDYDEGVLHTEASENGQEGSIRLQLQNDGILRLTLELSGEEPLVLYLMLDWSREAETAQE